MAKNSRRIGALFGTLVLLSLPVIGFWQRWNLYDYVRLHGYNAPAPISQLATDTTMNDKMRKLFYVYHPKLEDKNAFNGSCNSSEKTIVLGCYINGQGIYLYNVTDVRLNGVIQVTAAHESLHAAYARLSPADKSRIGKLIDQAYTNVTDERIKKTVDDYRKNGADVTNELHSILGTEVRNLPPELEQYYTRYFTNRSKIVSYSEQYEQAFTERKQKVDDYDNQLADLKQQIDSGETNLDRASAELKAQRQQLDQLLQAKNIDAYNAGVPDFNAKVSSYNAQVRTVRSLIDRYNTVVAARNAIAAEEGELVKAIDSRPDTLQTQ